MPLIPVELPAGMYKNGTPYGRRGRWEDGNLVRWHDGSIRPIGGWGRRTAGSAEIAPLVADPALEAVRDIFAWRDLTQNLNIVFGSNLGLYHLNQGGVLTDVTYAGYTPTNPTKDAELSAGYGDNPYGSGFFGVENNLDGQDPTPPDRWYMANFGEILITGVRNNGAMHELDLGLMTLSAVTGAPTTVQDATVTDQRQIFAIGGDGQPRRLQSSEVEDRNNWTPAIANQVIDRTLSGTGRLLRCVNMLKSVLILGENDVHVARYIGPPYVYSVDLAGENCGPLSTEALAITDRFAMWWGKRTFWVYDGSVQQVDCDVIDFLYADIEMSQASKVTAFVNTEFSEIWWIYQSSSTTTTEVDSYVCYNYQAKHWTVGRLDRTAGLGRGVTLFPIMVDSSGAIYNHELGQVFPDGSVFVETGAINLGNGEQNLALRAIHPDTENTSDVTYDITARQFPNGAEYAYGPYPYNNPIPTRAMGKSIKVKVNFQSAHSEHGIMRLDVAPSGTGKK